MLYIFVAFDFTVLCCYCNLFCIKSPQNKEEQISIVTHVNECALTLFTECVGVGECVWMCEFLHIIPSMSVSLHDLSHSEYSVDVGNVVVKSEVFLNAENDMT